MKDLLIQLFSISLMGGGAALLVWAVAALLRKAHAPSQLLCLLWLVAGARFLLPGGIPLTLPKPQSAPLAQAITQVQQFTRPTVAGAAPPPTAMQIEVLHAPWYAALTFWHLLAAVWAIGTVVLLIRATVGYVQLRQSVALACKTVDGCYTCATVTTPFTLGFVNPRIYMPANLQGETRRAVLRHERTHLKRRDTFTKPLFYLVVCLHWWNPLVWLAFNQFERCMETACDEAALRGQNSVLRSKYCETILTFALPHPLPACLAFGQGNVRARIAAVLHYRKPSTIAVVLCSLAVVLACTACVTSPTVAPAEPNIGTAATADSAREPAATPQPDATTDTGDEPLPEQPAATPLPDTTTDTGDEPLPEQPAATPLPDTTVNDAADNQPSPAQPAATPQPTTTSDDATLLMAEQPASNADGAEMRFVPALKEYVYVSALKSDNHKGDDYAAEKGTPVYAVQSGTITAAAYDNSYGNCVVIDHGSDAGGHHYQTLYAQMDTLSVTQGQSVAQGEQIGTVGSSGNSTGNHLHIELLIDDALVTPSEYIPLP